MNKTTIIIYFITFFIIGELIIRADMKYNLSYSKSLNINDKDIEKALTLSTFEKNFYQNCTQNRIMIIGNSFIKGISIQENNRFSNVLLDTLKQLKSTNKPIILDLSSAGNTALDNYLFFKKYFNKFNPTTVLWFHSLSDIKFDKKKLNAIERSVKEYNLLSDEVKVDKNLNFKNIEDLISSKKEKPQKERLNNLFYYLLINLEKSKLIYYLKSNLLNKVLTLGLTIPFGDFFYLTKHAYVNSNKDFIFYKNLLYEIGDQINREKGNFIFYNLPEFNLLENPKLFEDSNNILKETLLNENIKYIDGLSRFKSYKSSKLTDVRTDSHPNEIAHKILVNQICKVLNDLDHNFFEFN